MKKIGFLVLLACLSCTLSQAQESTDSANAYLKRLIRNVDRLNHQFRKTNARAVKRFQDFDRKVIASTKDTSSATGRVLVAQQKRMYAQVGDTSRRDRTYIPELDTLKSLVSYLKSSPGAQVDSALLFRAERSLQELDGNFQLAHKALSILNIRKNGLAALAKERSAGRALLRAKKTAYYYKEQVQEYKRLLADKRRLGKKLVANVLASKPFQSYIASFGQLMRDVPVDWSRLKESGIGPEGLLARANVQQSINSLVSRSGPGGADLVRQSNLPSLNALRKARQAISGLQGNSAADDGFVPNTQKTKRFSERLQPVLEFSFQKSSGILPAGLIANVGLNYKVHDRFKVGIEIGQNVGLGKSLEQLSLTYEGFVWGIATDYQLRKAKISIVALLEQQHRTRASKIGNLPALEDRALLGISRNLGSGQSKKNKTVKLLLNLMQLQRSSGLPLEVRFGQTF